MGFRDAIQKLLKMAGPGEIKLVGKAARIDAGFKKIYAFIARGVRLNPAPKYPPSRHPKTVRGTRARGFFRTGDAGVFPGTNKPRPYQRDTGRR